MIVDGSSLRTTRSYFETAKVVLGTDMSDEAGFAFADNRRTPRPIRGHSIALKVVYS